MRVPQVNERVKEVPAHALRAMFAGIGQLLSVSDKIRNKSASAPAPADAETPEKLAPETVAPETVAPETVVAETAAPETVAPETVSTGNRGPGDGGTGNRGTGDVAPKTVAPEAEPEAPAPTGRHAKVLPADAAPAATAAETAPAAAAGAAAGAALPVPNYDDLTIASLRARLRNLSADQLNELIDYEKGHAARPDVITMFERRIAKLAEG